MLRFGNGMILSGMIGTCMVNAPTPWFVAGMGTAFVIGYIFPAMQ